MRRLWRGIAPIDSIARESRRVAFTSKSSRSGLRSMLRNDPERTYDDDNERLRDAWRDP